MAIPRNTVDHRDVNPKRQLTFPADGVTIIYSKAAAKGHAGAGWAAVGLSSDNTVELVDDGDQVFGELLLVEPDGMCTVRTEGVSYFKGGTEATFTLSRGVIGALRSSARGYVKGVTVATQNEEDIEFGRVSNDTDADAIEVHY